MRHLGTLLAVCALATAAHAQQAGKTLPVPVHPDTLPTLQQAWSLPASLAPLVTNVYAPRMAIMLGLITLFL